MDVVAPVQISGAAGVAVTIGEGLITTVDVAVVDKHVPLAGMVLVTVYVPAALNDKLIAPVLTFTNTKPTGDAENIPALAPGPKVGNGLLAFWQKGEPE